MREFVTRSSSCRTVAASACALILFISPWSSRAALAFDFNLDWKVEHVESNLRLYSAEVDGSTLRAVKATTVVDATVAQIMEKLIDISNREQWDPVCAEAYRVGEAKENSDIVYLRNSLPWPLKDRDMVIRREWGGRNDAERGWMVTTAVLSQEHVSMVDGVVRLNVVRGKWKVELANNGGVRITMFAHAEPGGTAPEWLADRFIIKGPLEALHGFRKAVEGG